MVEVFGPYRDIGTLVTRDFEKVGIKVNMQIRERALHFQMRQANDLQAELWNQDTAGFPFTGSTKYDFRKDLYGNLTYGPLWKQWFDTNGKEGVEPPPEAKRIIELQDKAKAAGPAREGRDRPGALQDLGGQHVRDRHRRPDRDRPGRGRGQREAAQRSGQPDQGLAAAHAGQRPSGGVVLQASSVPTKDRQAGGEALLPPRLLSLWEDLAMLRFIIKRLAAAARC